VVLHPGRTETKREKFLRIGAFRMTRTLGGIKNMGNLSNRSLYEYTEDDVTKMIGALNGAIGDLAVRLKDRSKGVDFKF
jgi:hypothetical protein